MTADKQTFWEHLDELRRVLFKILILIAVIAVGAFCIMPWFFDNVVLAPCSDNFPFYRFLDSLLLLSPINTGINTEPFSLNPVSLELTSQFFVHFSSACWLAVVVAFPIVIYLLWGFISPALYENEKKGIRRAFLFGNLMFYLGVLVGYFIVFPLILRFLASYRLSPTIDAVVSLDSYMENFYTLILLMGALFELPLMAWLLGKMGLINRGFFKKYRRHALVVLLIVAALITPTGDPFTLLAVFIPIYALWEISGLLVPRQDSRYQE